MLGGDVPEPAGGKPRLDNASCAHPEAREHRIRQRVGMKQRQVSLMHVALMQILVRRVDLAAPKRIGVGPQHRLWSRRGARSILHAAGRRWIDSASRPVGAVAEQALEAVTMLGFAT